MARRSILRRPKGSPSGLSDEEAPSAFAELRVMKTAVGDDPALPGTPVIAGTSEPVSPIITMLRRLGIAAGIRVKPGRQFDGTGRVGLRGPARTDRDVPVMLNDGRSCIVSPPVSSCRGLALAPSR
jgi:hypothetical protein